MSTLTLLEFANLVFVALCAANTRSEYRAMTMVKTVGTQGES